MKQVCSYDHLIDYFILFSGKPSGLRYVTPVLIKILKIRKSNENATKDWKEELFDMTLLDGTLSANCMTPIERIKVSINN